MFGIVWFGVVFLFPRSLFFFSSWAGNLFPTFQVFVLRPPFVVMSLARGFRDPFSSSRVPIFVFARFLPNFFHQLAAYPVRSLFSRVGMFFRSHISRCRMP